MRSSITTLALALFAVSCAERGTGSDVYDKMATHNDALRTDTQVHGERVAALGSLDGVPAEEAVHHGDVVDHAGAMHDEMNGMSGMSGMCGDDQGSMHDLLGELEADCLAHQDAMEAAGDLTGAFDEELRHQEAMEEMLEDIDAMRDQMQETCGDMTGGMGG